MSSTEDQSEPVVTTNLTSIISKNQPEIFAAIDPSMTFLVPTDVIMRASLYKWNQTIELPLSDGKKV